MFLFIVGLATGSTTAYLAYREYKAKQKQHEMINYVNYLTKDMRTNESIRDAFLIGAGSTAISVFSVYTAIANHKQVLDIMEYRYPNELMDMSPLDWLTKVETLYDDGDAALNGFINGYAGQAAENITVEQFEAMGASATLFESRTHANDDIEVTMNGETINYSVKSYADADSFARAVDSHPESTHYVVNQELYTQLEQKGLLSEYEAQGITIMEGNYSNVALREEATKAFFDIHDAADVADNIPFLSVPLFALRSGFNVKAYRDGKQSGNELTINMLGDAGKIGVSSGLGFGGAKLGGVIGTAIFPGIGTIIGGGLGAVLGAIAGSKVVESIKNHFKWGKIIEVQEKIGRYFINGGKYHFSNYYLQNVFNISELDNKFNSALQLNSRFENQIDLYSHKKLSMPAVLHAMYIEHSQHLKDGVRLAAEQIPQKIESFAQTCASKIKKPNAKNAFIGELLLSSDNSKIWIENNNPEFFGQINDYEREINKNPHYPYQFQVDGDVIVNNIVQETLDEQLQPKQYYSFLKQNGIRYVKPIIICSIVSLLSFISFFARL